MYFCVTGLKCDNQSSAASSYTKKKIWIVQSALVRTYLIIIHANGYEIGSSAIYLRTTKKTSMPDLIAATGAINSEHPCHTPRAGNPARSSRWF